MEEEEEAHTKAHTKAEARLPGGVEVPLHDASLQV
jgi:hypothetical protein